MINPNPYAYLIGGGGAARIIDDGSPWTKIQQATLPKIIATPPRVAAPPAPVAPLPKGLLPVAYVDPIITGVSLPAKTPSAPSTPGTAVTVATGGANAGCLSCGSMTPPPQASVTVQTNAGGSGGGSGSLNAASLLTGTSGDVPWWVLVVGAAVVGYVFRNLGK